MSYIKSRNYTYYAYELLKNLYTSAAAEAIRFLNTWKLEQKGHTQDVYMENFILENKKGTKLTLSNVGAAVVSLVTRDRSGKL